MGMYGSRAVTLLVLISDDVINRILKLDIQTNILVYVTRCCTDLTSKVLKERTFGQSSALLKDRFCRIDAHLYSCKCGPNLQAWFMRYAHRKCLAPLDYWWPIPPMTNADGMRTKNSTPSPSAPLNTPFSSGKDVGIKRTLFI